jgi:hypothetical protein
VQDRVQAVPLDELHGVVVHPLMLAHAVDRYDVAVVELARRAGLEPEPLDLVGGQPTVPGEDLQRDAAAHRLLRGFIHDPHPAPSHLADQAEVAQLPDRFAEESGRRFGPSRQAVDLVVAIRLEPLDDHQRGEEVADLLGQLRISAGVLGQRRALAPPLPLDEFLGEPLDGIPLEVGGCVGRRHGRHPRGPPFDLKGG